MSKLLIKFPTRNRPKKFKHVLEKTINYLSGKHDTRFVITMDNDDTTMNTSEMRKWLDDLEVDLIYHYGDSKTKVEACNANLEGESADIILLLSDDMVPCFKDFDDIIVEGMLDRFPQMDGAIKFCDGLRPPNDYLMTLPILGWKLYESFGYLYHPSYTSVFCDNEMTLACLMVNKLAISPVCLFRHEWTNAPFDELHARNENQEMYQKDGKVFEERRNKNYEIENIK
tara:strand:+ start:476 stop:1159 length:684 start_codon:yes stop_codon:yes gene_type:complete